MQDGDFSSSLRQQSSLTISITVSLLFRNYYSIGPYQEASDSDFVCVTVIVHRSLAQIALRLPRPLTNSVQATHLRRPMTMNAALSANQRLDQLAVLAPPQHTFFEIILQLLDALGRSGEHLRFLTL